MAGVGGHAAGPPPFDTGIFARPKPQTSRASNAMSWTQRAFGTWMVKNCKTGAARRLLKVLRDGRCRLDQLPKDPRALRKRFQASMASDMPQFPIDATELDLSHLETEPPPKQWAKALVVNRGVVPCLVSAALNPLRLEDAFCNSANSAEPLVPGTSAGTRGAVDYISDTKPVSELSSLLCKNIYSLKHPLNANLTAMGTPRLRMMKSDIQTLTSLGSPLMTC